MVFDPKTLFPFKTTKITPLEKLQRTPFTNSCILLSCLQNISTDDGLAVKSLIKDFGSLRAVNNLSFGVNNKECFGLLGINGAGKTTTFR